MNKNTDSLLRILTVLESDNEAENLAAVMRNNAIATRIENALTPHDLKEAIKQHTWDIIILSFCTPEIDATEALEIINDPGPGTSIIVVTDDYNAKTHLELIKKGASQFISNKPDELVVLCIKNEYEKIQTYNRSRQAEVLIEESEKRNQSLMNSSRDAIAYVNDGMHIYSNQTYLDLFGFEKAEDLEAVPIMDLIAEEDAGDFRDILKEMFNGKHPDDEFKFLAEKNNGEKFEAIMSFSAATVHGEPCTQILIRGNQAAQAELDELRRKDLLTELYNRNYLSEQLDEEAGKFIENDKHENSAFIYIDLDGFKSISEKIGLSESDIVLRGFSRIILDNIGKNDLAARYAGDIFAVLVKEKDINKVKATADSIRKALEEHNFDLQQESIKCTASIGIVQISENSESNVKILSQGESACKVAKNNGGNSIYAYTLADEKAKDEHDQKWVQLINQALSQDQFYLLYQPIVSLHGASGQRYEVIIRLQSEDSEEILPEKFMAIAEETGLRMEIDRWLIKQAVKDIIKNKNTAELRLFVKLSTESLQEKSFLIWLNKLIKAAKLPPGKIVFEISEATVSKSPAHAKAIISNLKKLGCLSAISQAGHSKDLFDFLKTVDTKYLIIDPLFTSSLTTSEQSQKIVQGVTNTAKKNKIMSIAENANDAGAIAVLYQTEIDFIQGDYLQPPDREFSYDFSGS